MRPYTNEFKAEEMQSSNRMPPLPAGAYVGVILGVKLEDRNGDQEITVQIDVNEGPMKAYYHKQWQAAQGGQFPFKYKGTFRFTAPAQGSEHYEVKDRGFRSAIWAIEQSNPGYRWNWDEQSLKNKLTGFVVRDRDWEFNGNTGTTTEIGCLTSVDKVRAGTAPVLKKRALKKSEDPGAVYTAVSNEPLPF